MSIVKEESISILLVEDDDIDVRAFNRACARESFSPNLLVASDGAQALEIMRTQTPTFLIIDLHMPLVSGHELLHTLRSTTTLKKLLVFVLTTSDHNRDIADAYGKHIGGYFLKSKNGSQYQEIVQTLKLYCQHLVLIEDVGEEVGS